MRPLARTSRSYVARTRRSCRNPRTNSARIRRASTTARGRRAARAPRTSVRTSSLRFRSRAGTAADPSRGLSLRAVRVLHLPVNLAGTGWAHVNALRRKGVDARLLVFRPQKWRPHEYDINLDLPRDDFVRPQLLPLRRPA